MELTQAEIRVLGCLVEKQRTTPDGYPLSLNSLRLACNQATNRDPVVDYDERTVREAVERLSRRRLARLASGAGSRAVKYRHLADETLGLPDGELALLAVLMLRGTQTPGELKGRVERLHRFADLAAVHEALDRLVDRGLAMRLERRPGQKEERYAQLLGGAEEGEAGRALASGAGAGAAVAPRPVGGAEPPAPAQFGAGDAGLEKRVDALERELRELRASLDELRRELGAG